MDINHPLLQGPRRIEKKSALTLEVETRGPKGGGPPLSAPATVRRKNGQADRSLRRQVPQTEQKKVPVQSGAKRSPFYHPDYAGPEPDSPEFDTYKHGLMAPPRTRNLLNGKYID